MSILWTAKIFGLISSVFAFGYGVAINIKRQGVLFMQIIVCMLFCFLMGNLYDFCYLLCIGVAAQGLSIGNLGYVGGMFFLLSSYYGAMDRIGDSGEKKFRKYRVVAYIAPLLNFLVFILGCVIFNSKNIDFISLIFCIVTCATSYFALKHLMLPDVELGILKSMRVYNLLILILCFLENFYNISYVGNFYQMFYVKLVICFLLIILPPICGKGVKRWSI